MPAMSAAADSEDKTEKHPVTPGVPRPARELYGVMLLESAYVGAAKAAEKSGESAKAQEYYSKVVAIADAADNSRTEVAEARAFLTKR